MLAGQQDDIMASEWRRHGASGGPAVDLCALRGWRGLLSTLWHEHVPSCRHYGMTSCQIDVAWRSDLR